ncbi:hypothetical protein [Lachnoclostridium sp.]|uniref:hypothetical protein n=1 Tax=Lachnoclostridium sp. TaxID=2028282 RepID=UPI00289AA454|nr:hypothetical protein [Lachnoclostridium sp.]
MNIIYVSAASDPYLSGNKWNKSVVNIYIDSTPAVSTIPTNQYILWRLDIILMIERWNNMLSVFGNNINFSITNDINSADTIIKYGQVNYSWAETKKITSGSTILKATIILDDWDFATIGFNDNTVQKIVVHELGHVLGLADITNLVAENQKIYSVMVNDVTQSPYFRETPTFDFDRLNLNKPY